jgi:hypothetical protein
MVMSDIVKPIGPAERPRVDSSDAGKSRRVQDGFATRLLTWFETLNANLNGHEP